MKRARVQTGSVVLDKRIKTWNFFWWDDGKRRSKAIGSTRDYPTKASAWRAAKALRQMVENQVKINVTQYREEKMPKRLGTRLGYDAWLNNHVLPRWAHSSVTDLQARPVELWLQSLALAPKSRVHIRGLLHVLWDFAMWRVRGRQISAEIFRIDVGRDGRQPFQNSYFQCFQQLQGLPWDC